MTEPMVTSKQQQQNQEEMVVAEEEQLQNLVPRELGGTYTSPYFVDKYGNEYESYAMAWRYLGLYMDCGSSSSRTLSWYDSYKKSKACYPKVLWAAYHDPNYNGGSIGEYQYYDWESDKWDQSTCKTGRCAKMDCHASDTEWELIGVYKESVEFDKDTFFEQLFKHEGYCLWDGDKTSSSSYSSSSSYQSDYSFMQSMRGEMPDGCTVLSNVKTSSGGSYYVGVKPLSEGAMTLGIYTDSYCQTESSYSFAYYQKYTSGTTSSSGAFDRWNKLMTSYKVCQPCRAYNTVQTYNSDYTNRNLVEYYDGKGDEEQWGYNCYDDAKYRNCNQCMKFETHTDMSVASASDLAAASSQGTIMAIKYLDGTWYGSGSIGPSPSPAETSNEVSSAASSSYSAASSSSSSSSASSSKYSSSSSSSTMGGYSYYHSNAYYRYSFVGAVALVVGAATLGLRRTVFRRRPKIVIAGAVTDEPQPPSALLSATAASS